MKRHPDLQSLSRDHHRALVVAQRLKHVDDKDAIAARAAFLEFWHRHGQLHFRVEKEVLLHVVLTLPLGHADSAALSLRSRTER
jgi:hypothetical protein